MAGNGEGKNVFLNTFLSEEWETVESVPYSGQEQDMSDSKKVRVKGTSNMSVKFLEPESKLKFCSLSNTERWIKKQVTSLF